MFKTPMHLFTGLEILQKNPALGPSRRVLVSIKSRAPSIKTLYVAEKNRFHSKQVEFSNAVMILQKLKPCLR